MKKALSFILSLCLLLSLFSGCSRQTEVTTQALAGDKPTENVINGQNNTNSILAHDGSLYDVSFSDFELDASYSESGATKIRLNGTGADITGGGAAADGSVVTVSAAGTYIISGSLSDGRIIVDNEAKTDIHLVLNSVNITCSNNAAVFIKQAGNTKITLVGDNTLSDEGEYVLNEEEEPTAVLFSKDDLAINGEGSLTVLANYKDGITSKDDLKITGGTYSITAADDGLVGKDILAVKDGSFTVNAGGHGFKSSNDTDEDKGIIHIEGGDFTVSADGDGFHSVTAIQTLGGSFVINSKDDGFHSDASVMVNGGNINIESCYEGIEGKDVFINDGTIYVTSTDDALNAAGGSSDAAAAGPRGGAMGGTGNTLTVNGGYVCIKTGGDGIDINGSGYINGGTVIVCGPQDSGNASIDYDGQFEVSGGTLITAGSSRMAQVPSGSSAVYTVACNTETQPAGTLVHIEDADGNNIVTFAPCVDYSFVSVTSPLLKKDSTYKFALGGSAEGACLDGLYENPVYTAGGDMTEFTLTDIVTYIGGSGIEQGGNGFEGPRGNKGGMPMPGGETRPEKPEDNKFKGSKPQ